MMSEVIGLFVIPALAGGVSGWIYWLAAGRPAALPKAPEESAR